MISWSDKKIVNMISTVPVEITKVERVVTKKRVDGGPKHIEKRIWSCPDSIPVYNKKMGGVDLAGCYFSMIYYNFKAMKWTQNVIIFLIY